MKERISNIEMLRVASMLMIIGHHLIFYGVLQNYDSSIAYIVYNQGSFENKVFAQLLLPGGVVGVGIFFLIMGYFGIQSDRIRIMSVVKDTLLYSVLGMCIYFFLCVIGVGEIQVEKSVLISCFNPIVNSAYWFVSVYIIISLMKPAMNHYIRQLTVKQSCFCVLFALGYYMLARYNSAYYMGISNGLFFYQIGSLIKLNEENVCKIKNKSKYLCIGIIGWILYVIFTNISSFSINRMEGLYVLFGVCVCGTISVIGISIFFLSNRTFINKTINLIASSTFAVYLLHEHPMLRKIVWSDLLCVESIQWKSTLFPLYATISVVIIFIVLVIIDMVRKNISNLKIILEKIIINRKEDKR